MPEKKQEQIHILNVRLPPEIIEWLEGLVKKGIYGSKSEAIRDFMREYIMDNRQRREE